MILCYIMTPYIVSRIAVMNDYTEAYLDRYYSLHLTSWARARILEGSLCSNRHAACTDRSSGSVLPWHDMINKAEKCCAIERIDE